MDLEVDFDLLLGPASLNSQTTNTNRIPAHHDFHCYGLLNGWLEAPWEDSFNHLTTNTDALLNAQLNREFDSALDLPLDLPLDQSYSPFTNNLNYLTDQATTSLNVHDFTTDTSPSSFLGSLWTGSLPTESSNSSSFGNQFSELAMSPNSPTMLLPKEAEQRPPEEAKSSTPAKKRTRNRPCDLRRQEKKITRPAKCTECGYGASQQKDLKRHIVSRHKDKAISLGYSLKKFQCRYCQKELSREDHLLRHLRRKHGGGSK